MVVLVGDPGEEGDQDLRSTFGRVGDVRGILVGDEVERGDQDQTVCVEGDARVHNVDRHPACAQQPMHRFGDEGIVEPG